MPHRQLPNSNPTIIRCLKTARDEWKRTPVATDRAITADLWAKLDDANPASFLNRYLKEASDVDLAVAAQAPVSSDLAAAAAQLTMNVSHFHQVFDLGVARGVFKAGARSYYSREVSASAIPDLSTHDAVAEAAEAIIAGEAARAAAEGHPATYDSGLKMDSGVRFDSIVGYVPMALPSAAEVAAVLAKYQTLADESDATQTNTDQQREELSALYDEAQALAVDICDTVEFFYRKDPDASSRRTKAARWGVVYIYDPSEPQPPPTPATASTTPATPPTP